MLKTEPPKLCDCGCDLPVPLPKITHKARDYQKKQPVRFIARHSMRLRSGENNSNWKGGKELVKCDQCGKNFFRYPSQKRVGNNFCSNECHGLWKSINQNYENNPNWLGGSSRRGYCSVWTDKEYQEYILSRDNYKCQNPQCLGNGNQLHRHHIDYDKKNCDHNNIITICNSCNSRANSDREWHMSYYQAIMAKKLELGNMHYG